MTIEEKAVLEQIVEAGGNCGKLRNPCSRCPFLRLNCGDTKVVKVWAQEMLDKELAQEELDKMLGRRYDGLR